jgi:cytochrome c5
MSVLVWVRARGTTASRIAVIISCSSFFLSLITVASVGETQDLGVESSVASKPLPGRRVYKRVCMACHTLSVWGAPKLGDREAWAARISKGKEVLYFSAKNGFNAMPPRGNCQFCTDEELKAAVDYMVEKVRPRKIDGG